MKRSAPDKIQQEPRANLEEDVWRYIVKVYHVNLFLGKTVETSTLTCPEK